MKTYFSILLLISGLITVLDGVNGNPIKDGIHVSVIRAPRALDAENSEPSRVNNIAMKFRTTADQIKKATNHFQKAIAEQKKAIAQEKDVLKEEDKALQEMVAGIGDIIDYSHQFAALAQLV